MSDTSSNGDSVKTKPQPAASEAVSRESTAAFQPTLARELWLLQLHEFMDRHLRSPTFLACLHCYLTLDNLRVAWFGKLAAQPAGARTAIAHPGDTVR